MGLLSGFAKLVNLLVHFSTVMVTVLTSTSDGKRDSGRMPRSNTSNLTQTPVSLTWQTGHTPTGHDTFVTLTLCYTNDVNHFILLEHGINRDLFFKKAVCEIDFLGNCSTVHLDFHKVGFLLLQSLHFPYLSKDKKTYDEWCI
ncbi:hypothetical protein Hanom_Chr10g00875921 [Helianthus anomalus]